MIKRLYVDNYKRLVNFDLEFQELTLLVGRNGAGKTSVLDVMFALRQLLAREAKINEPGTFPTATLTRWQTRPLQVFELDVEQEGEVFRYRLELEHDRSARQNLIKLESLTVEGQPLFHCAKGEVKLYNDRHEEKAQLSVDWSESFLGRVQPRKENQRLTRFLDYVRKVTVCGLYPATFLAESSTEDPMLDRNGHNFASWYRHVLLERQELVPEFTAALQDVIDGFRGIRLEKVGLDTRALMVVFEEQQQKFELRLDEVSDGQRALIALYALVRLAAGQGYTLFLDEPDNYVALAEIQPWLIELADACGQQIPQAVLCSHHPELIDYLGADRGVLLEREASGVTRAVPLSKAAVEGGLALAEQIARGWLK